VSTPRPEHPAGARLSALSALLGVPSPDADPLVTGVTHASTDVQPGDLFAALPGLRSDGADFAASAVAAGAVAVLAARPLELPVPVLVVPDPRAVMGLVAAEVHGHPSRRLLTVGITGTNGKTTTAAMVDAGFSAAGHTTAVLGTLGATVAGIPLGGLRTTPEATDLQALLALAVERGVTAVTMEVSSHALALHRVSGVRFAVAGFTNLSQDHLDFHQDMESYFAAKALLFRPGVADAAVIDVTDPWGRRLAEQVEGLPLIRVEAGDDADTALLGAFNRRNAAVAVAILEHLDVPGARAAVAALGAVPGRMEQVSEGQDFIALVDYAHTPDAVSTLLAAVRPLGDGRVTVVLGCGGDRDRGKRPLMGAAAAEGADRVILTDDNPRSERSEDILDDMLAGVPDALRERVVVCPDRVVAMELAVGPARAGDVVVIAGKGHEAGQEISGVVYPFDDRIVLRSVLRRRLGLEPV
jgi:UDP-N-acetylmuramoyl-L-alanyl-D-glutamate--2,6-diaminopimelate ligase